MADDGLVAEEEEEEDMPGVFGGAERGHHYGTGAEAEDAGSEEKKWVYTELAFVPPDPGGPMDHHADRDWLHRHFEAHFKSRFSGVALRVTTPRDPVREAWQHTVRAKPSPAAGDTWGTLADRNPDLEHAINLLEACGYSKQTLRNLSYDDVYPLDGFLRLPRPYGAMARVVAPDVPQIGLTDNAVFSGVLGLNGAIEPRTDWDWRDSLAADRHRSWADRARNYKAPVDDRAEKASASLLEKCVAARNRHHLDGHIDATKGTGLSPDPCPCPNPVIPKVAMEYIKERCKNVGDRGAGSITERQVTDLIVDVEEAQIDYAWIACLTYWRYAVVILQLLKRIALDYTPFEAGDDANAQAHTYLTNDVKERRVNLTGLVIDAIAIADGIQDQGLADKLMAGLGSALAVTREGAQLYGEMHNLIRKGTDIVSAVSAHIYKVDVTVDRGALYADGIDAALKGTDFKVENETIVYKR